MAVSFETCGSDRIDALRTFFAEQYAPSYILARDREFLIWQFGSAPGIEREGLDVKLAIVDGEIGGCVGYIPVSMSVSGRLVRGAWAANWMVDDQYRKLGLGPLLMRELCRDFDVTLALGGNRDAHALLPRMGWTDFGDLPRFVAVLDRDGAARLTERGELPETAPVPDGTAADVERVEAFDAGTAQAWEKLYGKAAGTRRSPAFLNWRYASHPVFDYRLFQARAGKSLEGFAVYRIEEVAGAPPVGRLVELVAPRQHAAALLRAVVADARAHGVAMLDFFCLDDRLPDVLAAEGFMSGPSSPASLLPMLFQPVDHSRTGVLFMAHMRQHQPVGGWYVTTADGDQDRPN